MSRLEEIEVTAFYRELSRYNGEVVRKRMEIDLKHYNWLIQQAERVEEVEKAALFTHNLQAERISKLEKELDKEANISFSLECQLNDAMDTVKSYKQALEEIANAGENIDDLYYYQEKARELINQSK